MYCLSEVLAYYNSNEDFSGNMVSNAEFILATKALKSEKSSESAMTNISRFCVLMASASLSTSRSDMVNLHESLATLIGWNLPDMNCQKRNMYWLTSEMSRKRWLDTSLSKGSSASHTSRKVDFRKACDGS